MRISTLGLLGGSLAILPVAAAAQWAPGVELAGQSVQVQTNGVVNSVHFAPGGVAHITTPNGRIIEGTWSSGPSGLCLNANGAQECWSYATPLSAGQPVSMTSSCGAVSTWTAAGTNTPPPPAPPQASSEGERG